MRHQPRATFSVTVMMREDRDVVERFISFYRHAGAEHIYIYFDGATEPLAGLDLTSVTLEACTPEFWHALCGGRPQTLDGCLWATHKYSAMRHSSDWLLVVDADEFLVGGSVSEMLALVPDDIEALRLRNVEAVWGPGDDLLEPFGCSYFRKPIAGVKGVVVARLLYGRVAPYFTQALVGHAYGKHFLRRGTAVTEIRSHYSLKGEKKIGEWAHKRIPEASNMAIAHYDAVSFARWCEKWRRRYSGEVIADRMSPRRVAQLRSVQRAIEKSEEAALKLFRRYYGLSRWQAKSLERLHALERHRVFVNSPNAETDGFQAQLRPSQ